MIKSFLCTLFVLLPLTTSLKAAWIGPIDIFTVQSTMSPVVGVDAQGNAVIAASVSDDLSYFYEKAAQLIQGTVTNIHDFPSTGLNQCENMVSVNAQGNALVTWLESIDDVFMVQASVLLNNIWDSPSTVSDSTINADPSFDPGTYIDASNRALATWTGIDTISSLNVVQANRYIGTWQGPEDITLPTVFTTGGALAGSPSGNAMQIWFDGATPDLFSAFFNGSTWDPVFISSDVSSILFSQVAMNANSQALILWVTNTGISAINFANGVYGPILPVYTAGIDELFTGIDVALDDKGNGIAMWTSFDNVANTSDVRVSHFINGIWGSPITLNDSCLCSIFDLPNIGVDSTGSIAYAVWEKLDFDLGGEIYYSQFSPCEGWQPEALLSTPGVPSLEPFMSVNAVGQATVVWYTQNEDESETTQAVYTDAFAPCPPQNFTGKQVSVKFLVQTEYVNILKWKPSPSANVVAYYLYRNGILIAVIPASGPLTYQDPNRNKKQSDIYQLVAIGSNGVPSPPVTLGM